MKELLKSVYICQSYCKNKKWRPFLRLVYMICTFGEDYNYLMVIMTLRTGTQVCPIHCLTFWWRSPESSCQGSRECGFLLSTVLLWQPLFHILFARRQHSCINAIGRLHWSTCYCTHKITKCFLHTYYTDCG